MYQPPQHWRKQRQNTVHAPEKPGRSQLKAIYPTGNKSSFATTQSINCRIFSASSDDSSNPYLLSPTIMRFPLSCDPARSHEKLRLTENLKELFVKIISTKTFKPKNNQTEKKQRWRVQAKATRDRLGAPIPQRLLVVAALRSETPELWDSWETKQFFKIELISKCLALCRALEISRSSIWWYADVFFASPFLVQHVSFSYHQPIVVLTRRNYFGCFMFEFRGANFRRISWCFGNRMSEALKLQSPEHVSCLVDLGTEVALSRGRSVFNEKQKQNQPNKAYNLHCPSLTVPALPTCWCY